MDADVLIAGAGPTGLMLANQLSRRGVRVLIVDRNAGPVLQSRALGVQARTLEIYSHLGIAEQALALGTQATGSNVWAEGRLAAHVPLGAAGRDESPYPYVLVLGQDDNERLLGEALSQQGVGIRWNTELVSLAQESDHVTVTLKNEDGRVHPVTVAWVAGCDGARSRVREMCGIPFPGAAYEHVFFVADVQMTGTMVPDEVNAYLWQKGFHLFFPMRGSDHWRIVGILPPELRGRDDLTFEDVIPSVRQEAGAALAFRECTWFSTYRIHHRHAERFRDRRCFLLGDAAHIHSPVGGQGMNTGLQDAYNLAWKLALVVSGRAHEALLDTYEAERLPVAQRLLETSDRGFSLLVSDRRLAGWFRTRLLPKLMAVAMGVERMQKRAFRAIAQTGIAYPNSPLSQALSRLPGAAPRAGDRFPWLRLKLVPNGPAQDLFQALDDTRFHLLMIGQTSPEGGASRLRDLVCIHEIPSGPENDRELARAGIPRTSFFLLRPDGHVGLTGSELDAAGLERYLAERVHMGNEAASVPSGAASKQATFPTTATVS